MGAVLGVIGKALLDMLLALVTASMIKRLVIIGLEAAVSKYERAAAKSETKEDDAAAASVRKVLEEAKKAWNQ